MGNEGARRYVLLCACDGAGPPAALAEYSHWAAMLSNVK
jgi:hypothetical protein